MGLLNIFKKYLIFEEGYCYHCHSRKEKSKLKIKMSGEKETDPALPKPKTSTDQITAVIGDFEKIFCAHIWHYTRIWCRKINFDFLFFFLLQFDMHFFFIQLIFFNGYDYSNPPQILNIFLRIFNNPTLTIYLIYFCLRVDAILFQFKVCYFSLLFSLLHFFYNLYDIYKAITDQLIK